MSAQSFGNEDPAVQRPLLKYAGEIGWKVVPQAQALSRRRGEGGLFFYQTFIDALVRLNPGLLDEEGAAEVVRRIESTRNSIEGNQDILAWLRGERTVYDEKEKCERNVRLIDYGAEALERNEFHVTEEWQFTNGLKPNRADVIFLINGIPVILVENKKPKGRNVLEEGLIQVRRYHRETPEMVTAAQVFDLVQTFEFFFGVTWNTDRKNVGPWKGENHEERVKTYFDRRRVLRLLGEWILFFIKDDELQKAILRQHQTRATEKILARCADPAKRTGLVWHTQGSGKTFTMIIAARELLLDPQQFGGKPTVLLIIDRNELEGQLQGWVEKLLERSDVTFEYADSKARLRELFAADYRGLIVSMIHKFDEMPKGMCTRDNVFVLIDEAHRSTGGDFGNYLVGALPNATLIGFTGTPIDKTAHGTGTFKIFGAEDEKGYLDKYSIRESMEDRTTLRLHYTHARNDLVLDEELLEKEFLELAEAEGVADVDELNKILESAVRLKTFLKNSDRVEKVAAFVKEHFTENVQPLGYKAFLVAVDREACALYKEALDRILPPEITAAVYTSAHNDSEKWPKVAKYQLDKAAEKKACKLFKKPAEDPQILIVTDKLLTGYDAPILYCMYLDKPMRDHVLLQAIARVNRPYEAGGDADEEAQRKPSGLVVDFVGIFGKLKKALAFDSEEVSGVVENLEVLLAAFQRMMAEDAPKYIVHTVGGNDDKAVEAAVNAFSRKEAREEFFEFYKRVERLYEILSPSPDLRDYIDDFSRLASLYDLIRSFYSTGTTFWGEVACKTESLIREDATIYPVIPKKGAIRIDEQFIKDVQDDNDQSDANKVVNLIRILQQEAEDKGDEEPYLIPIAERAKTILDDFDGTQEATSSALEQVIRMLDERRRADEERKRLGLDINAFTIFWELRNEEIENRQRLAEELDGAFIKFANHRENAEELRQLKAELYKILLQVVDGKLMVEIADRLLAIKRREGDHE